MKNIVLGVTGSIAAYKAANIISALVKGKHNVNVVMTEGATKFITPLTLQTLSKNRVYTNIFQEDCPQEVKHITIAEGADLLVIAPITANVIGKLANGMADDMLSAVFLATKGIPIIIAPAMNTRMYENPVVQENLLKLKNRGVMVIEPRESLLACGSFGKGALADTSHIIEAIEEALAVK